MRVSEIARAISLIELTDFRVCSAHPEELATEVTVPDPIRSSAMVFMRA